MVLTGGCYCGSLAYEVTPPLGPVVNCHCAFCRRIHGAAFTTAAVMPAEAFVWTPSSACPSTFETPLGNVRHFCAACASPIWNYAPYIETGVLIVGSLAQEFQPAPWLHVNTESMSPSFAIADALPRFSQWPDEATLRALCDQHPGAWVPEPLFQRSG